MSPNRRRIPPSIPVSPNAPLMIDPPHPLRKGIHRNRNEPPRRRRMSLLPNPESRSRKPHQTHVWQTRSLHRRWRQRCVNDPDCRRGRRNRWQGGQTGEPVYSITYAFAPIALYQVHYLHPTVWERLLTAGRDGYWSGMQRCIR
jgi:hypothetical protein